MSDQTISERIQMIVDQLYGGNVRRFCIENNFSVGTITGIIGTRKSKPSIVTLEAICDAMVSHKINRDWICFGKGNMMFADENISDEAIRLIRYDHLTTTAPLISQYAAAGYLAGFSDPEYLDQQPVYVASKKYSGGNYIAFEIRGESMNDGMLHSICNADLVLAKELKKEYWGFKLHIPRIFIIVHETMGIICKEIIEHDVENGIITCHSFNPQNRDFELHLKEIAQLFYIKEVTRDY